MPSPNIIAAALSRNCPDTNIVVLGDSVALYNPPLRVAEEIAMLDGITGGRMIAGFPVGSPMDTIYAYGQNPATLRERYHEGVDLIRAGMDHRRGVQLQRELQQAALCQRVAPSGPAAPPADLDSRRRLGGHLGTGALPKTSCTAT